MLYDRLFFFKNAYLHVTYVASQPRLLFSLQVSLLFECREVALRKSTVLYVSRLLKIIILVRVDCIVRIIVLFNKPLEMF